MNAVSSYWQSIHQKSLSSFCVQSSFEVTVEWLAGLLCIQEILGSFPSLEVGCFV